MSAQFDDVASAFIERTRQLLPGADVKDLYWGFHFMTGAMVITFAETGRIDLLSRGRCKAARLDHSYARMIPFLAAGFERLAGGVSRPGKRAP